MPEEQPVYKVSWVAGLPRPSPFRLPGCMPAGASAWRRLNRQLVPAAKARGNCCWMPGQLAARLTPPSVRGHAQQQGVSGYDIREHVVDQARNAGITGWELDALSALTDPADGIQIDDSDKNTSYINGQHKAQAMLGQGPAHHHHQVALPRISPAARPTG